MAKKTIPVEVQRQAEEIVERFNRKVLARSGVRYVPRFKGSFLLLDRQYVEGGRPNPICRLKYTGPLEKWEFAIYKYSDHGYDPDEWFFPGSQFVDGTIQGAMKAGLEAYPD